MKKTTIKQLLADTIDIDIQDAKILLAYVLDTPREFLLAHPEHTISTLQKYTFQTLIKKRAKHIPIAYLTGHKAFYGLDFIVNKHTLVPRPETELMVNLVCEEMKTYKDTHILLDVGTGSGCIPIGIIKAVMHENIQTYATDISKQALKTAKHNATKHNVDITFLHGNLLEPFLKIYTCTTLPSDHLIITANLPYLTEEQFQEEPSIQKEPKSALVATDQGLALYRELLNQLQSFMSHHTVSVSLFMEIDPSQTSPLCAYIEKQLPKAEIQIHTDLCGRDRIVSVHLNIR